MPYSLAIAGGILYRLTPGGAATPLPLPAGVTLSLTRPPLFVVLGRAVLIAHNPSRSLIVGPDFDVRPMQLAPPVSPAVLAGVSVGGLTGVYKVKYTHIVKDPASGALLAESDFSPVSQGVTLVSAILAATGISPSPDAAVTHHRIYRTLADGEIFYHWIDIDASQTLVEDDLSDILLPNLAAPRELGVGPGLVPPTCMRLFLEWKGRLWGVGDRDIDTLRYSGEGISYGWPATYGLDIMPIGGDEWGITALMKRRDLLGVAKRQSFWKVSGGLTNDEGIPQFDVQREKSGKGCFGPSIVVDDTAYYLGPDGVYSWGAEGFDCVSDGKVRQWFATDKHFNRALFPAAFMVYNERYDTIELHMASAGSLTIDRWVSFERATGAWFGPHRTAKATPTSGFGLTSEDSHALPVIGADDGVIYMENQPGWSDAGVAIAIAMRGKYHDGQTPTISKVFGGVSLVSKRLPAIGNCLMSYRVVDEIDADNLDEPPPPMHADARQLVQADMRIGTETLPRIGEGRFVQLDITEDTDGAACEIYGYEIPYFELGLRTRR